MAINDDYYGNNSKWFVAKVKGTADPLGSNRVRLFIPGVHPDECDETTGGVYQGDVGSASLGTSLPGDSGFTTGTSAPPVPINDADIPKSLDEPISKYFKLRDLVLFPGASQPFNLMAIKNGQLDDTIKRRLTYVAKNILDPIRDAGIGYTLTSGWRSAGVQQNQSSNHASGAAADIVTSNMKEDAVKIYNLLKGRVTFVFYEIDHIHVQGSTDKAGSAVGTLDQPVLKFKA